MLGLSAELTRVVAEQGYSEPTPVQAQAIPVILAGRDVLAGAQTGTGKTAGFTLPLLQRLSIPVAGAAPAAHTPRRVRALILTPTRELAAQVEESVRTYGQYLTLKSTLIYGGVNINPQIDALRRGVDILVATPGRLLDHLQQKTASLTHVEILVLDEADRMLDMGFIRDIRRILALLPARRQNLLFSATFSNEIRQLADGLLHAPALIDVARRNAESELVAQLVHPVDGWRKRELLTHLVSSGDWRQVLVFTRMKSGANRLAEYLCKAGIEATAIHGNKSQPARTRALAGFKAGTVRVLVATDIAARGLDIEELPHVVNFELPNVPADYVHRIGRTGRAGSTGVAISLVSAEEGSFLADIEKLLTRRIERQMVSGFEPGQVQPPAAAEAQAAAERAARDANRRGTGRPGKPAAARPGPPAAQPARKSNPAPQPGSAQRAPQRARAGAVVALPALFRSPTRRGS
ncbi:MAG: DEAD/DEAH box helicase [Candidatus Accumulibacter sp.]|uniref:DEAD-box ATP-dependent RNA helicase RhpA n=1 Tax=Candidatus Accumulibacter proximus TaxID=2954385 RepID=A0A935Q460_9PROT|nr:DEAD/DEAH box helicase [Candidatus Accumulibacter proximus]